MGVYLLQAAALGFAAGMTPGPTQFYLIARAVKTGWQRTLPGVLAPLLTDVPIIALTVLILTQLSDDFLFGLQVAGNLFILYLAINAFQAFRTFDIDQSVSKEEDTQKTLTEATLTNLLNPNPYIFWGTVGGQILLEAWRQTPLTAVGFLAAFYVLLLTGLAIPILLFGLARGSNPTILRALIGISALGLFALGIVRLATALAPYFTSV